MKTKIFSILLILFSGITKAQYNSKTLTLATEAVGAKFTYENMRVYPIYANDEFRKMNASADKYLSLKEAMKNNKIKVSEKNARGESAEVNKLTIQNESGDTVMILGGEIIEGGKQDRMIASDMILPPHSGKVDLEVYCVEHGRWKTKSSGSTAFNFSVGNSNLMASPTVRKAGGVSKDQSKVWEEVSVVTEKNKCTTSSGTYTALTSDSVYNKKVTGYRVFFTTILKSDPKIIGAVYVTGNKILGCDLFATHDMFLKHAANLLNSYSTEAISNGTKVSIAYADVKKYTDNLLADEKKQDAIIKENGTMLKQNGNKLHIATY